MLYQPCSLDCVFYTCTFYLTLIAASLLGMVDNSTQKDLAGHLLAGLGDLLVDGDMKALSDLVYSNLTEVLVYEWLQHDPCTFYLCQHLVICRKL